MAHHPEFKTILEVLAWRSANEPDRVAFTYLVDGESTTASLTYRELETQVRAVAARLQSEASAGDRILLLYPAGLEFISAFFGCLYAGMVAVPAYPPKQGRNMHRLQAIADDAQAALVLTTRGELSGVEHPERLGDLKWIATDEVEASLAEQWQPTEVTGETLAFLQYTSGSTANPKGVMVTQANLLYNERMMQAAFQSTSESVMLGWVPLFHDMGLILIMIQALFVGAHCLLMSPLSFIQKPIRWLAAISKYRVTHSGGPNFGYEHCLRKIPPEQRAGLDLSSWKYAYNAAEPVRADTQQRFAEAFAPYGFQAQTFYPCYGLAEATVFVCGGDGDRAPEVSDVSVEALAKHRVAVGEGRTKPLVSCGHTWLEQRIVIASPETHRTCGPDEVGEIWVGGPNIAQGYWQKDAETEHTFRARLADTGEGPFLRTGDLGYMRNGEVYVTGRLKDVIIIRGVNHYPQDIERTAEQSHPSLRPGCSAAFTVEIDGEDRLVIVAEVERRVGNERLTEGNKAAAEERLDTFHTSPVAFDPNAVVGAIRKAVSQAHDLSVHEVKLLMATTIPKTSSGKIQRRACKAGFLGDSLMPVP